VPRNGGQILRDGEIAAAVKLEALVQWYGTQAAAAEALGVPANTVARWLRNEQRVTGRVHQEAIAAAHTGMVVACENRLDSTQ